MDGVDVGHQVERNGMCRLHRGDCIVDDVIALDVDFFLDPLSSAFDDTFALDV